MARAGQNYDPLSSSWTISALIESICQRAGVPVDLVDTSQIVGHVEGFSTTMAQSAGAAIDTLGAAFMFDSVSADGLLVFIPKGGATVAALTGDDLIDRDDSKETVRHDTMAVAKKLVLNYFDTEGGLTADKQESDRSLDNRSKQESSMETTVIMRQKDAAAVVAANHKIMVEEQSGEVKFSLPIGWLWLTPADCITLDGDRYRIISIEINDTMQTYTAVHDRASAYDVEYTGNPIAPPSDAPDLDAGDTILQIVDCPPLRSADDLLMYYAITTPTTNDWNGAVVELSTDGGATYIAEDYSTVSGVVGALTATLPASNAAYPDRHSVLRIDMLRDDMELITATLAETMNRINTAMVGNELINFMEADQVGPKSWELRGLLRGRKGTAAVQHLAGERFMLLDYGLINLIELEPFYVGKELTFKSTSFGNDNGLITAATILGNSQRERQPAYLRAVRSGANVVVTWQGVGRTGGGVTVGMGQYFSGYKITLGSNVYSTVEMTTTIPYQAGTLKVQQVNKIMGDGPAAELVI